MTAWGYIKFDGFVYGSRSITLAFMIDADGTRCWKIFDEKVWNANGFCRSNFSYTHFRQGAKLFYDLANSIERLFSCAMTGIRVRKSKLQVPLTHSVWIETNLIIAYLDIIDLNRRKSIFFWLNQLGLNTIYWQNLILFDFCILSV